MKIKSSRHPSESYAAFPGPQPQPRTPHSAGCARNPECLLKRQDVTAVACKVSRTALRVVAAVILALAGTAHAAIATFEDLTLPPESYWNGADGSGGFHSIGAFFQNNYDAEWDYWDGFAYSNRTDTETQGAEGQYNAITGSGQKQSAMYGVAFVGWEELPTMTLSTPRQLDGLYVTNDSYTYYALRYGSQFSKKLGGDTGDDADWFRLSITGQDAAGEPTGKVEFYLADFRSLDNAQDYIVNSWEFVDLTSLGMVKSLQFALESSDTGAFGMNTPGYFCLDTVVPEPATLLLLGCGALFAGCRRR
jgi:hypothetical protein